MSGNDSEQEVVKFVIDEGMSLLLMDGTKWNIDPRDISTVLTWVPGQTLKKTVVNAESFYSYSLYNIVTGRSVRARKDY